MALTVTGWLLYDLHCSHDVLCFVRSMVSFEYVSNVKMYIQKESAEKKMLKSAWFDVEFESFKSCKLKLQETTSNFDNDNFSRNFWISLQQIYAKIMAKLFIATIVLSCAMICFSFSPSLSVQRLSPLRMSAESNIQTKINKVMSTAFIAVALIGPPVLVFTPVQSVHADVRAQQKRTYFRFVPKLIIGKDFYKTTVKDAIDKEDWPVITKFFEEFVSKYNPNDPTQVDSTGRIM